jgi:hypothetical protein
MIGNYLKETKLKQMLPTKQLIYGCSAQKITRIPFVVFVLFKKWA